MGRKRRYKTNAERQRAYRRRQKSRAVREAEPQTNVNWTRSPTRRPQLTRFAAHLNASRWFSMPYILKECGTAALTMLVIRKLKQTIKQLTKYLAELEEHRRVLIPLERESGTPASLVAHR
jgi:hypothetical protein